jgi:hypothetical protein
MLNARVISIRRQSEMKKLAIRPVFLLATLDAAALLAQSPKYVPLNEYMMARDAEIALAESAAPDSISGRATIKVGCNRRHLLRIRRTHWIAPAALGQQSPAGQDAHRTLRRRLTHARDGSSA